MKKFKNFALAALVSTALGTVAAHAAEPFSSVAVGPVIGTNGYGVQVSVPVWPDYVNLNTGFSTFSLTHNVTAGDVNYAGKLQLGGVPIYLSVFPFKGNFHLDGGLYINQNRLTATATPQGGSYTLNGNVYSAAALGQLNGATHFSAAAPYVGLGWGNPFFGGNWTFTANAGALFEGNANIRLNAPNEASVPGATADIAAEEHSVNSKVSFLNIYPIINIGVEYRF